jgi:toxin ParE1/3/4
VPKRRPPFEIRVSHEARRDIRAILEWTEQEFGKKAALRYAALLAQALRDIGEDPERPGSLARPEIAIKGARTYHLEFSRGTVKGRGVKAPRHFLLYRRREEGMIEVGRVIHDARDLERHLPEDYRFSSHGEKPS